MPNKISNLNVTILSILFNEKRGIIECKGITGTSIGNKVDQYVKRSATISEKTELNNIHYVESPFGEDQVVFQFECSLNQMEKMGDYACDTMNWEMGFFINKLQNALKE